MHPPPPFFRLPLELRNRIYHFALLNQRATFKESSVELYVSYTQEDGVYEEQKAQNLRWLFTSRRVLSEGLEQFYQHATLEHCYVVRSSDYPLHELTLDGKRSVFELGRIGAACLSVTMGQTQPPDSSYQHIVPRGKERFDSVDEDFAGLGRAIVALERCALGELEMNVRLFRTYDHTGDWEASGNRFLVNLGEDSDGDDEDGDEDEDSDYVSDSDDSYNENYWNGYGTNLSEPEEVSGYVADFSFLKNLGTSWEKVKIKYTPTYMERYWGDSDPVAANVLAVPMIEENLAETAKELVGGEGWAIRDYLEDEDRLAAVWVLDVEQKKGAEKTGSLEHVGLHSYLAPCDECSTREEKFRPQPEEHGKFRFIGEDCGAVVEFETPVFYVEEGGNEEANNE